MRKKLLSILSLFVVMTMAFITSGCVYEQYVDEDILATETSKETLSEDEIPDGEVFESVEVDETSEAIPVESEVTLDVDGSYTTMEDVALYIYTYNCLPNNFMTKNEARALGWEGGSLEPYAPGMCIGGDYFGNYEGLLPTVPGREYHECDIDTLGASSRGAKRIIYSSDGQIYYTADHYESFTLIYGEE